jgi:hypothetical protein
MSGSAWLAASVSPRSRSRHIASNCATEMAVHQTSLSFQQIALSVHFTCARRRLPPRDAPRLAFAKAASLALGSPAPAAAMAAETQRRRLQTQEGRLRDISPEQRWMG